MESTYFSLVLILLGVIMGGLVVLSFLRGLTGSVLRRAMLPTPTPYYVGTNPTLERGRGVEWLLGLGLFIGLMLLLNAGKSQVESWWSQQELIKKPPSSSTTASPDSTPILPKVPIAANADGSSTLPSAQQSLAGAPDSIYVQIGAYTQEHSAEQLAQNWMQSGYSALLLHHDDEQLYKLCIGPFAEPLAAKAFIDQFSHLKGFIIIYQPKP